MYGVTAPAKNPAVDRRAGHPIAAFRQLFAIFIPVRQACPPLRLRRRKGLAWPIAVMGRGKYSEGA